MSTAPIESERPAGASSEEVSNRLSGKVRRFNPDRGWGFITRDDGQGEVFVHWSGICGSGYVSLRDGEWVTFALVPGKGPLPMAVEVRSVAR